MKEFFTVENQDGERIDRYLSEELADRSRSYIQKLIKENYVTVNQKPVKANYRLSLGDRVEIDLPEAKEPDIRPEDIPLDILYEDKEDVYKRQRPCCCPLYLKDASTPSLQRPIWIAWI